MEQLICQACGAKLNWDGVSDLVTCPYCGSRFNLRPRTQGAGDEVLRDGIGRGTVAQIPSVQADAGGACFLRSYVPSGWQVQCGGSPQGYGDPARDGAHCTTVMTAPGEKAFIVIRSTQTVRHVEPSMLNGNGARHLNLMGARVVGGGGLEGTRRSAAEYCDEMLPAIYPGVQLQLLGEDNADEAEQRLQQQILTNYRNQGMNAEADWKRRYYLAVMPDGKRMNAAAETRIVSWEQGGQGGMFGGQPGMFGGGAQQGGQTGMPGAGQGGMFGGFQNQAAQGGLLGAGLQFLQRMQQSLIPRFWEVQYELLFLADEDCAKAVYPEFNKVRKSFRFLPAFEQYKENGRRVVLQCQQQMMADTAASQQRRMNMMMETQDYIHNVQSDMMASSSASHDRVAQQWSDYMQNSGPGAYGMGSMGPAVGEADTMDRVRNQWSEAIKETNTYYGNDGKVYEASTSYDHVYQGNKDQDSFFGTSGTSEDPGVDYDELKRTNGNY